MSDFNFAGVAYNPVLFCFVLSDVNESKWCGVDFFVFHIFILNTVYLCIYVEGVCAWIVVILLAFNRWNRGLIVCWCI